MTDQISMGRKGSYDRENYPLFDGRMLFLRDSFVTVLLHRQPIPELRHRHIGRKGAS